jgi:hypothetical protein
MRKILLIVFSPALSLVSSWRFASDPRRRAERVLIWLDSACATLGHSSAAESAINPRYDGLKKKRDGECRPFFESILDLFVRWRRLVTLSGI